MAATEQSSSVAGVKRPLDSDPPKITTKSKDEESSSDDDLGPALPSSAPQKKKRRLAYERTYISALPQGQQYSKSLMHKEQITSITITPFTDFVITASIDGVVKFWKKVSGDIEFVKEFKAHDGAIRSVSVSADGRSFATAGADSSIKIFDVITFDLLSMVQLEKPAVSICYIHKIGASMPLLAVAQEGSNLIEIYDCRSESNEVRESIKALHRAPVTLITYNSRYDCVISCDNGGMLEYWSPEGSHEKPESVFKLKSATNLFEFKKAKSVPSSITVSPSGKYFTTFSFPDRRVRIFEFATGKLYRTYDESTSTLLEMQQTGTAVKKFEEVEFGRRIGVERETEGELSKSQINIVFDESSNFILYGSLQGIKVVNILTNQVVKVYGADEPFRALNLAIYQGAPLKKGVVTAQMAASSNPLLDEAAQRDPVLICTALGRPRFYMFTNEIEISKSTRDVQNEKPRIINGKQEEKKKGLTGTSAIMHTNKGDIHLRLFPEMAPKTVENFVTLSKRGFYNNTIFHRVVAKFMIQGGDPRGDGTGGESIWGGEFEDEITSLKHDQPYTLSMANAGKNTNLSQFFITTVKTPHLDGIHTVFGRAVKGHDVIHKIEHVKTNPSHRPIDEEIKIINIEIH